MPVVRETQTEHKTKRRTNYDELKAVLETKIPAELELQRHQIADKEAALEALKEADKEREEKDKVG